MSIKSKKKNFFEKLRKFPLDYVLKIIPAKFDDQSTVLHRILHNKIVFEWDIYPIETIKSLIGWCLEFTSKNWLSPTKL